MTEEPKHVEINEEDNKPATKADVRRSQEELARMTAKSFATVATKDDLKSVEQRLGGRIDKLDERMGTIETKIDSLATKSGAEAILDALQENTAILKEVRPLANKVARLERSVFRD